MRIFFGIWCLLFVFSAYLQLNDPDPVAWVTIYLVAAIFSAMAAMRIYPMIPLAVAAVLSLVGVIYYFPPSVSEWVAQEWAQQDLTMKTMEMEEARESFGFLLILIVLTLALYMGWRKKTRITRKYGTNYLGRN